MTSDRFHDWHLAQDWLYSAERRGFRVDLDKTQAKLAAATRDLEKQTAEFHQLAGGVSVTSPVQLAGYLYTEVYEEQVAKAERAVQSLERDVAELWNLYHTAVKLRTAAVKAKVEAAELRAAKAKGERGRVRAAAQAEKLREGLQSIECPGPKRRVDSAVRSLRAAAADLAALKVRGCLHLPIPPVTGNSANFDGDPITTTGALEWLAANYDTPQLNLLVRVRRTTKSVQMLTNILKFQRDGRIHTTFARETKTGRLASRAPNLQNIPADKSKDQYGFREIFIATEGYKLLVADFSQLELRVMAHILARKWGDENLLRDILAADMHSTNAVRVFGPIRDFMAGVGPDDVKSHPDPRVRATRAAVKTLIFGFIYGKSVAGFGSSLKGPDGQPIGTEAANEIMERFLDLYPGLRKYQAWVKEMCSKGYIPSLSGRRRRIRSRAEYRQALNYPCQAGATDIVDSALIRSCTALQSAGVRFHFLLSVHDELIWEVVEEDVEKAQQIVIDSMRAAWEKLLCPLDVSCDTGDTWAEAK